MTNVFWYATLSLAITCQLFIVSTNADKRYANPATSARPTQPRKAQSTPRSSAGSMPAANSDSTSRGGILSNPLKFLSNKPFNDFDWKLSKLLNKVQNDNLIVSTVSVKLVLGMLYLGVQDTTAREIENAFAIAAAAGNSSVKEAVIKSFSDILKSLENSKDNEYELNIGTKFYFDQRAHVNETFRTDLKKQFDTEAEQVDFKQREAAVQTINTWCKNMTRGKIETLITKDDLSDTTAMILLNAIYFRGEWENQFPQEQTKPEPFYLNSKAQITVPTMGTTNKFYYYDMQEYKTHLLRMPYLGKKFAMYLLVPHEVEGLADLADSLQPAILAEALNKMTERTVNLRLPKFQFESSSILVPILRELGIKELFSPVANLSNIGSSNDGPLMISSILQKSGIEVNERGSVAHAATEVQIDTRFGEETVNLKVTHPFFFLIADEQRDSIIFIGKMVNPLTASTSSSLDDIDIKFNENSEIEDEVQRDRYSYFDKEMLKELSSLLPDSNIVVSPASIKSSLALLVEGSAGRTETQLKHALRLPMDKQKTTSVLQQQMKALKNKSPTTILNSQNKIYIAKDEKLSPEYQNTVKSSYYSEIEQLDFGNSEASAQSINAWVNNITEGLIPVLVNKDQFDAATRLFLINCIYFKADWDSEFDPKDTRKDCFYNHKNTCLQAQMMNAEKSVKFHYSRDLDAKIVELPFKDSRYSMVFMLPGQEFGITNLIKDLVHQDIKALLQGMRKATVQLSIPKTTLEFSSSLQKVLEHVDIKDIFTPAANLSGILDNKKPVMVRDIIHKAKIEINEKGAKAAAATETQVVLLSAPQQNDFKANRPFLFFIRDAETAGFLFEGLVVSPDHVDEPRSSPPSNRPAASTTRKPNPSTTRRAGTQYKPAASNTAYQPQHYQQQQQQQQQQLFTQDTRRPNRPYMVI